ETPGSPTVKVDIEATSIKVWWTKPADDGGSPITAYRVLILRGNTKLVNRNITDLLVKHQDIGSLNKSSYYTIKLFARNYVFEGKATERKIQTKYEGIPAAAEITDLPDKTKDVETTLKWKQAENNGAPITQYTVYRRPVREDGTSLNWTKIKEITDTSDRQVAVYLEKGKAYAFVVTATNRFGEGVKEECKSREIKVLGGRCILVSVKYFALDFSCGNQKEILHAVYMTIICLLLISNLIMIFVSICSQRKNLWSSMEMNQCRATRVGWVGVRNPIAVKVEVDTQSLNAEQTFEAPTYASTASADYMPLHPSTRSWEISRKQVNIVKVIGKGAFSQVAKATVNNMRGSQDNLTVAVKMLKENAPASDKKDLLSELGLMKKLKPHPHVIKLLGCVTETEPLLVLIEYVPYGDLLGYLRKSRGLSDTYFKDPDMKPQTNLTAEQLMKFAWQVADGMCYLSSKKIIHRDLAARNVLVGDGEKCKVTDFGMARDVHQEDIYNRTSRGRLPVKWTAFESLMYGTYTTQSDVWSYGVLLYETLTVGGSPYPDINARKIAQKLQEGYRMPKPKHVEIKLYQIMLDCWRENPVDRPTFERLRNTMKEMERNRKTYVNLKQYDHSLYANVNDLKDM
ncbi:unnamed protein product, partial [Porites evermanni]